jgi:hypothetical protein
VISDAVKGKSRFLAPQILFKKNFCKNYFCKNSSSSLVAQSSLGICFNFNVYIGVRVMGEIIVW